MKKKFEDIFMEIQSGLISLCLEVVQEVPIEKVFAYGSIEGGAYQFDAFFMSGGKIMGLYDLGIIGDMTRQFHVLGNHDLIKLDNLCKEHEVPTPTELKLYYDVKTGKFDSQYKYEPVTSLELDSSDVFDQWFEEERAKNQEASAEAPKKKKYPFRWRSK